MNVTINTNTNEQTTISTESLVSLLAEQSASLPIIGDTNLFGETVTAADLARALRELSRVARLYADAINE